LNVKRASKLERGKTRPFPKKRVRKKRGKKKRHSWEGVSKSERAEEGNLVQKKRLPEVTKMVKRGRFGGGDEICDQRVKKQGGGTR